MLKSDIDIYSASDDFDTHAAVEAHGNSGMPTPTPPNKPQRALFSNKLAFVFAASASAIGLGNLWRFPALAARYGGGAFLLTYLLLVVTFGFALMLAEVALGRATGLSAIGAFKKLGKKYAIIGILASLVPIIITPYYCVIGGWLLKYVAVYITGQSLIAADGGAFFSSFIDGTGGALGAGEPIIWTTLFVLLTMLVVGIGLKNGIERLNKIFMPALFVLAVAISVYALTIPGALDGLAYYLVPQVENFGLSTVIAAMGQMFFSLSLAMGIMITYGSYMRKDDNLEKSVRRIEIFDTLIAILAGLMIIPAVFAFSGIEGAQQAGPSLMFVTMPQVFGGMAAGLVIGLLFFVLVLFAALTSAISLAETVVSIFADRFGWSRKKTVLVVAIVILLLAMPPTLGFSVFSETTLNVGASSMQVLDVMDFFSNSILMPLVALLTCLFIGYWVKPDFIKAEIERTQGVHFKSKTLFRVMIRYIAPIFLLVILVSSVLNAIGAITL